MWVRGMCHNLTLPTTADGLGGFLPALELCMVLPTLCSYIAYAVTFRFAAYLLTLPVDHTLYANFEDIFTVFLAVILGSLVARQASASSALTLTSQALSTATAVLGVMESPEPAEMEGKKKLPVSNS